MLDNQRYAPVQPNSQINSISQIQTEVKCCFCFKVTTGFHVLYILQIIGLLSSVISLNVFIFKSDDGQIQIVTRVLNVIVQVYEIMSMVITIRIFRGYKNLQEDTVETRGVLVFLVTVMIRLMLLSYFIVVPFGYFLQVDQYKMLRYQNPELFGDLHANFVVVAITIAVGYLFSFLILLWIRGSTIQFVNEKKLQVQANDNALANPNQVAAQPLI